MITKGILAASAVAAVVGATVIVTAAHPRRSAVLGRYLVLTC
jgi:hypothetical protein